MLSFVSKTKRKSSEGNKKNNETMNITIDTKDKENSKQQNNKKQPQELKSGTSLKSDINSPDQEAKVGAKDSKEGAVSEKFTTESEDTERKTTWEVNKSKIKPLHITDYDDLLVKTFGNLAESQSFHHHFVCSNRGCPSLSAEETQRQLNQRIKFQHNWILQPHTAFDSKTNCW